VAISAGMYGLGCRGNVTGLIDLDSDVFKAMLTTSAYVIDATAIDTHQFRSSVTSEITGTGYTAGGVTLTTVTVTYDAASNEVRWDFDDPSWPGATFTARNMVIYKSRGGAATADDLVMWVNFGADETVTSGVFTYIVPATGALAYTVL
jgi:hypothetical protein